MDKSVIFSTVATFIIMFLLGWLFYGILMTDFFSSNSGSASGVSREMPNMLFLCIGHLIIAFVMSSFYSKWARGVHNLGQGLQYGAWWGLLIGFGLGSIWYATSNIMNSTSYVVDGVWHILYFGIAGMVIAFVFSKTQVSE